MSEQGGDQTASEKQRRWNVFRRSFKDPDLEKLYQSYSVKQKRDGLKCFLYAAILFDFYMLAVPNGQDAIIFCTMAVFLVFNIGMLLWCKFGVHKCIWAAMPHVAWHVANAQLLASLFLKKNEVTGRDSLGWVLLLDYLVYVTLPLRLRYCIMLSVGTCASYLVSVIGLTKSDTHLMQQYTANCILLLTANVLGLTSYFLEEKQQRRAFIEMRQSLEVKLVIEEQSAEQERLLLSVLPEHVAVRMRQDLGSTDSQFKKIYMSRHENVSILYADIVGFTAISSTYSAQDLVKILNELFARFDKLSEKYQQLRIKILGDCYYCISGAPRERPDHAVLCVHMGLSMVKAIKYVQQKTNSPVDMRVGIHTGAVLAGVLGQRQWQFDVYSKDVELANKMESSGMAGRVHISENTLSFLDGEFEVEPAYGEKREESLRMAGIKTYFIVSVLKPFVPPKKEVQNGGAITENDETKISCDFPSDIKDDEESCGSPLEENSVLTSGRAREDSEDFKKQLRKELVHRDGHRELSKHTSTVTLSFLDKDSEKAYHKLSESFSTFSLLGCLAVLATRGVAHYFVLPMLELNMLSFTVSLVLLYIVTHLSLAESLPTYLPKWLVNFSRTINNSLWLRRIVSVVCILLVGADNIIDTASCSIPIVTTNCTMKNDPSTTCLYPSYYSFFGVLILVATAMPASITYIVKTVLMIIIVIIQCIMNLIVIAPALDCEESLNHRDWPNLTPGKFALSVVLVAATIALAFLSRHTEQVARVLFLWRAEVSAQRERAADMRRRNEALVYNVLPPHVAAHFMGNRKRQHDELYSQSYAEVGVLFASMPNFSDFYSEETVNNQGLECLRFLNEVISDFDALLELPQFQDIIKIKTIGSTYMAASGLNPSKHVKPEDPINVRWAHLALLVEFALELKKALQGINEQSFNHFVLKMGINHGPITAGVIGARKPHYDIWGNTVNVASRMESTGKAGCIQVTEETCDILQHFGYQFEQRGLVAVKGKGQLMTYYLQGKVGKIPANVAPVSPILGVSTMETLAEEEEPRDTPSPMCTDGITHQQDRVSNCDITLKLNDNDMEVGDGDNVSSTQPLIIKQNGETNSAGGTENSILLDDEHT